MNEQTLELFRQLTEMPAASGFEADLRRFVRSRLEPVSDEVVQDRLGSIFGIRKGAEDGLKIMVAGHMDEVGFMTTSITGNGMIRFKPLGGWFSQVLLAQRVQIVTPNGSVPGVIGSIPPHLLSEAARSKPVDIDSMFIDIGADDRGHAERLGVRPGLQIVPVCPFTPLADGKKMMAKAWDNRYGVGLAIELLQQLHGKQLSNTIAAGATVQEEVGLRGAETAASLIKPDLAFVLDVSPANDTSGDPNAFGRLGKGALLRILDRSMIPNPKMIDYVRDIAETHDIPYQYFISPGGTDAGRIHLSGIGVPTAVIGIAGRYIHSAASIIHIDDYAAAKELLVRLVLETDRSAFDSIVFD
ncbi:M42 family metallopeptidase [Paenibacillus humicola]|uniref:M42 family metallopeptidase n=1 Tax=Paenibacillus humicola TaxID=3110540 RepID=UPI00237AE56C|nr:M42 family metallopeptidase [Paenibacillus humicola]